MRATSLALCLACAACTSAPAVEQVRLGLGNGVPDEVASISFFVLRDKQVVATATVGPDTPFVSFGVPAEVPLEFRVVARTDRPGPSAVGKMPAFVGSLVRSIPLRAETASIAVTLHPAGVLTILDQALPLEKRPAASVHVVIESDGARSFSPELDASSAGGTLSFIVRTGSYHATVADKGLAQLDAPGLIFVEREEESLYILGLSAPLPSPAPTDTAALRMSLDPEAPAVESADLVRLDANDAATIPLVLTATDGLGMPVADPRQRLQLRLYAEPKEAIAEEGPFEITGIPGLISLHAHQEARVIVDAQATLASGRVLRSTFPFSILGRGAAPGEPARVLLQLRSAEELRTGTELWIEIVDAAGRRTPELVDLDLSGSDPHFDLSAGPTGLLRRIDHGFSSRHVAAASSGRDRARTLVVVATSTASAFTATASISLPPLHL
ncbi:MAG: hypothetical protein U1E65_10220 [Myxococcota bacterium]